MARRKEEEGVFCRISFFNRNIQDIDGTSKQDWILENGVIANAFNIESGSKLQTFELKGSLCGYYPGI